MNHGGFFFHYFLVTTILRLKNECSHRNLVCISTSVLPCLKVTTRGDICKTISSGGGVQIFER